jgi:hypothetical protein
MVDFVRQSWVFASPSVILLASVAGAEMRWTLGTVVFCYVIEWVKDVRAAKRSAGG